MFSLVVVGGTFDGLHVGHRRLLDVAFDCGNRVVVAVTSDKFAQAFRTSKTPPLRERREKLEKYVKKLGKPFEVIQIDDSYGVSTTDKKADCIVVSEETLLRAEEINAIRFKKGLPKLAIVVVPIVLAKDGGPVSSDRINRGEIDGNGNVL